jgi:hypothetical protein
MTAYDPLHHLLRRGDPVAIEIKADMAWTPQIGRL